MPHDDYTGGDVAAKMREANQRTLVIALVETARGIANVEEIMAAPGIDIGWLGHFDLTPAWGFPGNSSIRISCAAVDRAAGGVRGNGKPAGLLAGSVEMAEAWRDKGFRRDRLQYRYRPAAGLLRGA